MQKDDKRRCTCGHYKINHGSWIGDCKVAPCECVMFEPAPSLSSGEASGQQEKDQGGTSLTAIDGVSVSVPADSASHDATGCGETGPEGFSCCLRRGHLGWHMATGTVGNVFEVWDETGTGRQPTIEDLSRGSVEPADVCPTCGTALGED